MSLSEFSPSALPRPLTSFVGRTDELALARSLLDGDGRRLLTLTGPGGIGKTRLAIELAASLEPEFAGGVWFVSLAAVHNSSMVMPAIASALGLRELDSDTAPDAVAAAIGDSPRLLVTDNFEHVLEAAPSLTRLLSQCPHLKIVATSRSLLRVEGEHAIPVPPLDVPPTSEAVASGAWDGIPAIRLFIERARAVDPGYVWTEADIGQLIDICNRLDGLPLAIELAATKLRHLTLAEIRARLDERLPLLVDGSRDHPSRLQTMRNAIRWSHDLLAPDAQLLFRRLSVFHGGFSLEAAEAVSRELDGQDGKEPPVRDRISQLIDASLLLREAEPVSGTARYRMLETIREFAGELLVQHEERAAACSAHARFFTDVAERFEFADLLPWSEHAIERLIVERANMRAAMSWLDQSDETELFLRLIAAHGNLWASTANYREATAWYENALARSAREPSAHRAKIQVQLGMTNLLQGDLPGAAAQCTSGLASSTAWSEPYYEALALLGLATVSILQGDAEESSARLDACAAVTGQIGDRRLAELVRAIVSLNRGVVSRATGNLELAREQIAETLRIARAEHYLTGTLIALADLGDLARDRADWARALSFYREGLALGIDRPIKRTIIEIIESVGIVAFRTGRFGESASLLGAAEALRERTGLRYMQPESSSSLALSISGSRTALGDDLFAEAWELGRSFPAARALSEARAIPDPAQASQSAALTPRETDVVRLLVLGLTDPEIAATLFISVRTVENHVAHILAKLGVRTRTAAASAALSAGLAPAPPSPR